MASALTTAAPTPPFFVLGPADPVLEEVEAVLRGAGAAYGYACSAGVRVTRANTYHCDVPRAAARCLAAGGAVYLIECVGTIRKGAHRLGNRNHGEPGYGLTPERYWQASPVGQVCDVLGVPRTPALSAIAAAGFCPAEAYAGKCEGADIAAVIRQRAKMLAGPEHVDAATMLATLDDATAAVRAAESIDLGDGLAAVSTRRTMTARVAHEVALRCGVCLVCQERDADGFERVLCVARTAAQLDAFVRRWAPQHGFRITRSSAAGLVATGTAKPLSAAERAARTATLARLEAATGMRWESASDRCR